MKRSFTIGMAGHIDHGKTTLTKALTGVDTDQLQEEKLRNISIEPGFAPFIQEADLEVAIIDVPGHERFIRQMIAGVAGIDFVVLVIAADEGIMPQTKEHIHILSLLGIERGLIAVTKTDLVDEEFLELIIDDIQMHVQGTFLKNASIHFVDSVSNRGITELTNDLQEEMEKLTKKATEGIFRLPIDHVFTVKGQGVVVRGTVYDGKITEGEEVTLLPEEKSVRIRQIQRHRKQEHEARKGQRAAINISGVNYEDITRGDVLVGQHYYTVTDRIDVVFYPLQPLKYTVDQRETIKFYTGTSEVMGRIIFFDRNELHERKSEEILCQIELENPIVVARKDRFIIRRPSPIETIGGGWIVEPRADRGRFGEESVEKIRQKKEGTALDRIESILKQVGALKESDLLKEGAISIAEYKDLSDSFIRIETDYYTTKRTLERAKMEIINYIMSFHNDYPMRIGIDIAVLRADFDTYSEPFFTHCIKKLIDAGKIVQTRQFIRLTSHLATVPEKWKKEAEKIEEQLTLHGVESGKWEDIITPYNLPETVQKEMYHYFIQTERAYLFDGERLIPKKVVEQARDKLAKRTRMQPFNLQTAREILQLTRKNLVPLLELLDQLGETKRIENMRHWIKDE